MGTTPCAVYEARAVPRARLLNRDRLEAAEEQAGLGSDPSLANLRSLDFRERLRQPDTRRMGEKKSRQ
jgi:hypothetical protein